MIAHGTADQPPLIDPGYHGYPSVTDWFRDPNNKIPENMLWKSQAEGQMMFFRDMVSRLFLHHESDSESVYHFCRIAGWHTSKSIRCPVYNFKTPQIQVWARDNFFNWNVTVVSKKALDIPAYFDINGLNDYLYMEGMEDKKRGPYGMCEGPNTLPGASLLEFSFCTWNQHSRQGDHELYAIMRCIASQLDKFKVEDRKHSDARNTSTVVEPVSGDRSQTVERPD